MGQGERLIFPQLQPAKFLISEPIFSWPVKHSETAIASLSIKRSAYRSGRPIEKIRMQPTESITIAQRLAASAILLLGAILFSTKAVMVKLALPYGIDPVSLLALRMLFSLPIYLVILIFVCRNNRLATQSRRHTPRIIFLGIVGYYLASYLDFAGLAYISASLERVILYLYPTMVLLISAIVLKKQIYTQQWIAIGLCYTGVAIAVLLGDPEIYGTHHSLGVALISLSAFTYAIYLVGSGEVIPAVGVWRFTCYAMIVSSLCVITHYLVANRPSEWQELLQHQWQVYAYGGAMAVFATVIPSLLISEGIKRIGASNAAIIGGIGPISTIILASIFLGESLTAAQAVGTAIVICSVLMISLTMKRNA